MNRFEYQPLGGCVDLGRLPDKPLQYELVRGLRDNEGHTPPRQWPRAIVDPSLIVGRHISAFERAGIAEVPDIGVNLKALSRTARKIGVETLSVEPQKGNWTQPYIEDRDNPNRDFMLHGARVPLREDHIATVLDENRPIGPAARVSQALDYALKNHFLSLTDNQTDFQRPPRYLCRH